MPLSTDVIVRKEDVAFPPRCISCDRTIGDGEEVTLRGNPVGLHGVIPWLFDATRKLRVPAHRKCGVRLSRAILMRNLFLVIGITVVAILAVKLGLSKWQAFGTIAAAIVIPVLWQVLRPLAFEFTHHSDYFKLTFRDLYYARDVAALNDGELEDDEGEKDSGNDG